MSCHRSPSSLVLILGRMRVQGIAKVDFWWDKVCKGVGRHRGEERGMMSYLVVRTWNIEEDVQFLDIRIFGPFGWVGVCTVSPSDEDITTTPSPTTTSSSPTPPNAPSKTTSTNQTSSSQENTSSSFHSKLQISPPSSHEPTSPHNLNPLLDNISDVPPRPLNPQPLQSHPSLDITLSLSLITPLDHIHDTPSPPSPPQPQPPIMGHPLFYNYHDYHGSTCICCSYN
ncbi:hypothetical protein Tco_0726937 [Tanacetum coccineum]|uniref:Uncharacterized protein n=1 Tax=Tanacetum coccineum TaxID=301880 RepID=A0ABQ4YJ84_9ASTR